MSSIGEVKRITDDSPKFREVLLPVAICLQMPKLTAMYSHFTENGKLRKYTSIACWYTPRRNTMRCKLRILRWC